MIFSTVALRWTLFAYHVTFSRCSSQNLLGLISLSDILQLLVDEQKHVALLGAEIAITLPTSPLTLQKTLSPSIVSPQSALKRPGVISPITASIKAAQAPAATSWSANNTRLNQGSMYGFDSAYGNADGATDLWGSSAHANTTGPPPAVHYSPRHPAGVNVEDHSHAHDQMPVGDDPRYAAAAAAPRQRGTDHSHADRSS